MHFKVVFEKLIVFQIAFWYYDLASEDMKSQIYHVLGMYLKNKPLTLSLVSLSIKWGY